MGFADADIGCSRKRRDDVPSRRSDKVYGLKGRPFSRTVTGAPRSSEP